MVQRDRNVIKGKITSKGKERVRSARIGIACVCARSPLGIQWLKKVSQCLWLFM
jgi:hypothetical protein